MTACRWCAGTSLDVVLDLGRQPPADVFPWPGEPVDLVPLRMGRCSACGLAQLLEDPGVREQPLGVEPEALVRQAGAAVAGVVAAGLIRPGSTFVEFDSPHGGGWADRLVAAGARDVTEGSEAADLVVDVFGLMHDADQRGALAARVARLTPGGALALQYQPLAGIVAGGQWNALRHGHMAYYDDDVLARMLATCGLVPHRTWAFALYGGTTLLTATAGPTRVTTTTGPAAARGARVSAVDPASLAAMADTSVRELRSWLTDQRARGRLVLGYGAASRTTPLLNHAGVGPDLLSAVVDAAPGKWGRVIPGVQVPVVGPAELERRRPDVVLLFVPDLLDEVRRAHPTVEASGGAWAVGDPGVRLVAPQLPS